MTIVPAPVGRRPVVVVFRAQSMRALAGERLDAELVEWHRGAAPPPGHRADVCFGGYDADESALAWAEGAGWVHLSGVGTDNIVPGLLEGRVVTNSAGINAAPVAELAMALMLAAAKDLPDIWGSTAAAGHWHEMRIDVLQGRTLGILGFGSIGQAVARRALAFEMEVVVHTRTPREDGAGIRFVSKEELAATADHIVVAAPSTAATRHLVDEAFLARTKRDAHLVNVARGALVDQDALRTFLDSGHLSRASLDTVEPEPLPEDHWLRSHARVRLTPHIGGVSPHDVMTARAVARFAENFRRYRAGQPLRDVVPS
ncbi:MAG: NAD(P)-dependent oxidoreductase [Microbacterium sp.]